MERTHWTATTGAARAASLLLVVAVLAVAWPAAVAAQAGAEPGEASEPQDPAAADSDPPCDPPPEPAGDRGASPLVAFGQPINAVLHTEGNGPLKTTDGLPASPQHLEPSVLPHKESQVVCAEHAEPTVPPVDPLFPPPSPDDEVPADEAPAEGEEEPVATGPPVEAKPPVEPSVEEPAPASSAPEAPCDCGLPPPPDPAAAPTSPVTWATAPEPVHGPSLAAAFTPAGAVVAGALLVWRLLGLLLARPDRKQPLHPRAEALLRTVCAIPGLNFRQVRQATGLANGVALHHLARLLRDGRIVAHRHRNTVRFFENHGRYAQSWRQAAVLGEPSNRRLLGLLAANPGMSQAAIVAGGRAWGWGRGLTQKRLSLLEEAGLLLRRREGRAVRHEALPPAAELPPELRDLPGPAFGGSTGKL